MTDHKTHTQVTRNENLDLTTGDGAKRTLLIGFDGTDHQVIKTNEDGELIVSTGDSVQGPGTSTDNAVARYDGTTGKIVQDSGVIVDDSSNVTGVNDLTVNNNLVVTNDLTVNGTTTTINTETLVVEDKNIEMGAVTTPTDTTADGGGFTLKGTTDKTITWLNSTDAWDFNQNITINGSPVLPAPENSVIITQKSDFPDVIGGKIALEENTTYFINASFSIGTDNFTIPTSAVSNINFISLAFNSQTLTYEGSGEMFEDLGGIGLFNIFRVNCTNTGSGTLINPTPSVNPLSQVAIFNSLIAGFASCGTWTIRPFIRDCAFVNNTGGLIFNDASDFRVETVIMLNTSDLGITFISIGGTGTSTGKLEDITFTTAATETAIDIDSGIATDSFIKIQDNIFQGVGTILDPTGLDTKSPEVLSFGNRGLRDSRTIGSVISQGNDIATVISTIGIGESNYVDLDLGEATGAITAYATNGSGGTTVTSNAHGQPAEKLIEITGSTSYNGQHEIFTVTANTYDIDVTFVADDATGTWTSGAFADVDIERWELTDASNGELKYIGQEDFSGNIMATISAKAVGGAARRYKFRVTVNGLDGFAVPNELRNTITETTFRKGISVVTDDLVKVQVANFQDTSNVVIDTVSIGIE